MRGSRERSFRLPPPEAATGPRSDWQTLARLWPYLWQYKWRALFALAFVIGAKVANVGVYAERYSNQGHYIKVTEATVTYVAIDDAGRPRPVPRSL